MSSTTATASATTTTYANRAAFLAATIKPSAPPPGVTPNFDAPNPNGVFMIVVNIVGLLLCTTITGMRLWTKGVLMRTVGWDDYTCVMTLAGIFLWTVTQVKISLLGWGRDDYNIRRTNGVVMYKGKFEFMAQDSYLFSIGCVKVSILLMYLRVFTSNKPFKWTVRGLIAVIIGAHLIGFLGWSFSIIPVWCHWTYYPTDAEYAANCHHPNFSKYNVPYTLFLNVFTVAVDLIILYLPCRPVWKLQLAKRQRISILLILFAGVIVTIASLLRLAYFIHRFFYGKVDPSITNFRVNVISTFELDLAQLCCCLPILKPFMRQYAPSVLRLTRFPGSKDRTSAHPAASSQHLNKAGRKWPGGSRDEELIGSTYLELGEDGKSDQGYVMSPMASPMEVKEKK